jgi:hypothetical protein
MRLRKLLYGSVLFTLFLILPTLAAWADEPTPQELTDNLVLVVTAQQQLGETEWLFSNNRVMGAVAPLIPQHLVGWWSAGPPPPTGVETQMFIPYAPPPRNASTLAAGEKYVVSAVKDFRLIAVYAISGDNAAPMAKDLRGFEQRVVDARGAKYITVGLFEALRAASWEFAVSRLSDNLQDQAKSDKKGLEAWFNKKGFIRGDLVDKKSVRITELNATTATAIALSHSSSTRNENYRAGQWEIKLTGTLQSAKSATAKATVWRISSLTFKPFQRPVK